MTAIETMKYLLDKAESETPEGHQLVSVNIPVDIIREIVSTTQQWIPCKTRLPEEDGLYLVTTSKGQVQVHVFTHNGNSKEYWMRCNKAWMPLPEPWKGEQHG